MMLSGLLKSDIAVKVNIQIINAFVEMRKYLSNDNLMNRISNIETNIIKYDNSFKEIFSKCFNINKIEEKKIIKDLLDMI